MLRRQLKRIIELTLIITTILLFLTCHPKIADQPEETTLVVEIDQMNAEIHALLADSSLETITNRFSEIEAKINETKIELHRQQNRLKLVELKLQEKGTRLKDFELTLKQEEIEFRNFKYLSYSLFLLGLLFLVIAIAMRLRDRNRLTAWKLATKSTQTDRSAEEPSSTQSDNDLTIETPPVNDRD